MLLLPRASRSRERLPKTCSVQRLDPKSDGAARDWVAIYDECSRILYEEINYVSEAQYAEDFAANFKGTSWIKVPEIKRQYLSEQVIVMEYVPGVKINNGTAIDEMGLDRDRLARLSVESYLQQLLRHGLFHADPHPGNVAVDAVDGGRLIYYDFGMMGRIQPRVRCGSTRSRLSVLPACAAACVHAGGAPLWPPPQPRPASQHSTLVACCSIAPSSSVSALPHRPTLCPGTTAKRATLAQGWLARALLWRLPARQRQVPRCACGDGRARRRRPHLRQAHRRLLPRVLPGTLSSLLSL
jgi:ABC1 atypical kinase-like domain